MKPSILTQITRTLLAQDCLLCGAGAAQALLCSACAQDLPRLPDALCPRCAAPSPDSRLCGSCLRETPHFDASHACLRYAFPVDRLVQAFKYHQQLNLAAYFAALMARHFLAQQHTERIDMVIPLPLSHERLRERGYNQSLEIARPFAHACQLPLQHQQVARIRHTAPQALLPWSERQQNMRQAFVCKQRLDGQHVLIIDDVMTSGASLNEFARTLKAQGAARVSNWVLARAYHGA